MTPDIIPPNSVSMSEISNFLCFRFFEAELFVHDSGHPFIKGLVKVFE